MVLIGSSTLKCGTDWQVQPYSTFEIVSVSVSPILMFSLLTSLTCGIYYQLTAVMSTEIFETLNALYLSSSVSLNKVNFLINEFSDSFTKNNRLRLSDLLS